MRMRNLGLIYKNLFDFCVQIYDADSPGEAIDPNSRIRPVIAIVHAMTVNPGLFAEWSLPCHVELLFSL